jgi:hypothetical protein
MQVKPLEASFASSRPQTDDRHQPVETSSVRGNDSLASTTRTGKTRCEHIGLLRSWPDLRFAADLLPNQSTRMKRVTFPTSRPGEPGMLDKLSCMPFFISPMWKGSWAICHDAFPLVARCREIRNGPQRVTIEWANLVGYRPSWLESGDERAGRCVRS